VIIYAISFDGVEKYIGVTSQRLLCMRWGQHRNAARNLRKNTPLYRAMRKYGPSRISINSIASALSHQDMLNLEVELIKDRKTHKSLGGYNCSWGGDVPDHEERSTGEDHPASRISERDVINLRSTETAQIPTAELAAVLGISDCISLASLNRARCGVSWTYLNKDYPPLKAGLGGRRGAAGRASARRNLVIANRVLREKRV
jgi:hypothetical protein